MNLLSFSIWFNRSEIDWQKPVIMLGTSRSIFDFKIGDFSAEGPKLALFIETLFDLLNSFSLQLFCFFFQSQLLSFLLFNLLLIFLISFSFCIFGRCFRILFCSFCRWSSFPSFASFAFIGCSFSSCFLLLLETILKTLIFAVFSQSCILRFTDCWLYKIFYRLIGEVSKLWVVLDGDESWFSWHDWFDKRVYRESADSVHRRYNLKSEIFCRGVS